PRQPRAAHLDRDPHRPHRGRAHPRVRGGRAPRDPDRAADPVLYQRTRVLHHRHADPAVPRAGRVHLHPGPARQRGACLANRRTPDPHPTPAGQARRAAPARRSAVAGTRDRPAPRRSLERARPARVLPALCGPLHPPTDQPPHVALLLCSSHPTLFPTQDLRGRRHPCPWSIASESSQELEMSIPTTGRSLIPSSRPRPAAPHGHGGAPAGSRMLRGLLAIGLALAPARIAALPQEPSTTPAHAAEPGTRSGAPTDVRMTSPGTPRDSLTAEDYARAERFLSWNVEPLVYRADVTPNWMQGDRFWYRTRIPEGHEFIVVDPYNGTRAHAFDHERLAAALSAATDTTFGPFGLPGSGFSLDDAARRAHFVVRGERWTCDLFAYRCEA